MREMDKDRVVALLLDGDVGRRFLQPLDAARNETRANALNLAHLHHQVGKRLRLAEQRVASRLVAVGQVLRMDAAVVDFSLEDRAAARAAYAGAAAIGKHVTGIEPGYFERLKQLRSDEAKRKRRAS